MGWSERSKNSTTCVWPGCLSTGVKSMQEKLTQQNRKPPETFGQHAQPGNGTYKVCGEFMVLTVESGANPFGVNVADVLVEYKRWRNEL
ncbi:hypothetical protein [Candidatus Symbiopectobacterium endolongispinus]|uniref:hypothetical protein n=1 Tax=Candidatus Symbiopectobacterium endolongispinus TaxID=2812664 RepID=UPI003F683B8F